MALAHAPCMQISPLEPCWVVASSFGTPHAPLTLLATPAFNPVFVLTVVQAR